MIGYTLRRLCQALIVLLGLTVLVFVLEHIIPGNLARAILGPVPTAARSPPSTGPTGSTDLSFPST